MRTFSSRCAKTLAVARHVERCRRKGKHLPTGVPQSHWFPHTEPNLLRTDLTGQSVPSINLMPRETLVIFRAERSSASADLPEGTIRIAGLPRVVQSCHHAEPQPKRSLVSCACPPSALRDHVNLPYTPSPHRCWLAFLMAAKISVSSRVGRHAFSPRICAVPIPLLMRNVGKTIFRDPSVSGGNA